MKRHFFAGTYKATSVDSLPRACLLIHTRCYARGTVPCVSMYGARSVGSNIAHMRQTTDPHLIM